MITVVDHTEPAWAEKYARLGRENGAATYSRQIVLHHLDPWRERLQEIDAEDVTIATCGAVSGRSGDLLVQYLHSYPYSYTLALPEKVVQGNDFDRVLFVSAYRPYVNRLRLFGFQAVHVPMSVDAAYVASHASAERIEGRAIYFGNIVDSKRSQYRDIVRAFQIAQVPLDVISRNSYQDRTLSQEEAWEVASRYDFGVAVGRCALELMALGLPVMISGMQFGGLITSEPEYQAQSDVNFNGRVVTYDRSIVVCAQSRSLAITGRVNDLDVGIQAIRDADLSGIQAPSAARMGV